MTEIRVVRNRNHAIVSIEATGHSESRPRGEDMVCAAITTVFDMLSRGCLSLSKQGVQLTRNNNDAHWKIELDPEQYPSDHYKTANHLCETAVDVLGEISRHYTEFCQIKVISES